MRERLIGAGITVAVAGGAFWAVAAANAEDAAAPPAPIPPGHYSTIESQDPIEWVAPEPEPDPAPIPDPIPAPASEEPDVARPENPGKPTTPTPAQTFDAPEPEAPGMPNPMPPGLPPGEPIVYGD